ncbi:MAG: hypothetical protein ACSHX8_11555 [Opitutaceae bacterium]
MSHTNDDSFTSNTGNGSTTKSNAKFSICKDGQSYGPFHWKLIVEFSEFELLPGFTYAYEGTEIAPVSDLVNAAGIPPTVGINTILLASAEGGGTCTQDLSQTLDKLGFPRKCAGISGELAEHLVKRLQMSDEALAAEDPKFVMSPIPLANSADGEPCEPTHEPEEIEQDLVEEAPTVGADIVEQSIAETAPVVSSEAAEEDPPEEVLAAAPEEMLEMLSADKGDSSELEGESEEDAAEAALTDVPDAIRELLAGDAVSGDEDDPDYDPQKKGNGGLLVTGGVLALLIAGGSYFLWQMVAGSAELDTQAVTEVAEAPVEQSADMSGSDVEPEIEGGIVPEPVANEVVIADTTESETVQPQLAPAEKMPETLSVAEVKEAEGLVAEEVSEGPIETAIDETIAESVNSVGLVDPESEKLSSEVTVLEPTETSTDMAETSDMPAEIVEPTNLISEPEVAGIDMPEIESVSSEEVPVEMADTDGDEVASAVSIPAEVVQSEPETIATFTAEPVVTPTAPVAPVVAPTPRPQARETSKKVAPKPAAVEKFPDYVPSF